MDGHVTKEEFNRRIDQLATKLEFSELKDLITTRLDQILGFIFDLKQEHVVMNCSIDRIEAKLDNHERRIQRLERANNFPRIA